MSDLPEAVEVAKRHLGYAIDSYAEGNLEAAQAAATIASAYAYTIVADHLVSPMTLVGGGEANGGRLCPMCHTVHPLRVRAQDTSEVGS